METEAEWGRKIGKSFNKATKSVEKNANKSVKKVSDTTNKAINTVADTATDTANDFTKAVESGTAVAAGTLSRGASQAYKDSYKSVVSTTN